MFEGLIQSARTVRTGQKTLMEFNPPVYGLRSAAPAFDLKNGEASVLLNQIIQKGGKLKTRDPINKSSTGATASNASIKAGAKVLIGSTAYTLTIDANKKLDYQNSGNFTNIGTLIGSKAHLDTYNGVAIVCDGSYLKYCDAVSSIKLCYDDGDGSTGFQFDNSAGSADSDIDLGNGTIERAAYKFTSQTWDAGYTIPPVTVTAKLSRNGNGYTGTDNVNINVVIRKVSDGAAIATRAFVSAPLAENVDTDATEYSATFTSAQITTEMASNTAYYVSLEYANGDASHYIKVHCSDVASGGVAYTHNGAAWSNASTQDPIFSLSPGKPPKADFCCVHKGRLIIVNPDEPGKIHYSALTHLDWSSSGLSGKIGAIDSNANSFPIGGIVSYLGVLWLYGQQTQPYISRITGADPTDFAQEPLYQSIWTTSKLLTSVGNNLWSSSDDGVDPLVPTDTYSDVETYSASDPVSDRITDYFDSDTDFAVYNPEHGQYQLIMQGYHRIMNFHTKCPVQDPDGNGVRFPVSEYELYRYELTSSTYKWTASATANVYYCELSTGGDPSILEPDAVMLAGRKMDQITVFANLDDHEWYYGDEDTLGYNTVYIKDASGDPDTTGVSIRTVLIPTCAWKADGTVYYGASDGYIYTYDSDEYKDMTSIQMEPIWAPHYPAMPFSYANLTDFQLYMSAYAGAEVEITFYINDLQSNSAITKTLAIADGLTIGELIMDIGDMKFSFDASSSPLYQRINMNARTFSVSIKITTIAGYPIHSNGLMVGLVRKSIR